MCATRVKTAQEQAGNNFPILFRVGSQSLSSQQSITEGTMDAYAPEVERMMSRLFDSLRENDRRRYAALETAKLGYGGIE